MFEPGYSKNIEYVQKEKKWDGKELNCEESLFVLESRGLDPYDKCYEKSEFLILLSRKDNMNLSISMWKEEIKSVLELDISKKMKYLFLFEIVFNLKREFGINWINKVGIFDKLPFDKKQFSNFCSSINTGG